MPRLKDTTSVEWNLDTDGKVKDNHKIILVILGGASSFSKNDGVRTLAIQYGPTRPNPDGSLPNNIYLVEGYARGDEDLNKIQAKRTYENLLNVIEQMNGPDKILFVGKSAGGCLLWRVAAMLASKGIEIDLYVSVDPSCTTGMHWPNEKLQFSNVSTLLSFYQTIGGGEGPDGEGQTGHPVYHTNKGGFMDSGFQDNRELAENNINVNKVSLEHVLNTIRSQATDILNGPASPATVLPSSGRLCYPDVNHMSIDSCEGVLNIIREMIDREL